MALCTGTVVFSVALTSMCAVLSFYVGAHQNEAYGYVCGALLSIAAILMIAWYCGAYHRVPITGAVIDIAVQHLTETMSTMILSVAFTAVAILWVVMVFWSMVYSWYVFDRADERVWLVLFHIPTLL